MWLLKQHNENVFFCEFVGNEWQTTTEPHVAAAFHEWDNAARLRSQFSKTDYEIVPREEFISNEKNRNIPQHR